MPLAAKFDRFEPKYSAFNPNYSKKTKLTIVTKHEDSSKYNRIHINNQQKKYLIKSSFLYCLGVLNCKYYVQYIRHIIYEYSNSKYVQYITTNGPMIIKKNHKSLIRKVTIQDAIF